MTVEDLDIVAQVEDQFTSPLAELEKQLHEIGFVEESVFPIEADVRGVATAESELASLAATAETLDDKTVNITTDVDEEVGDGGLFQGSPNLGDDEAVGVADFFNPKSAFRNTPGLGDGGGDSGADSAADGGADFLSPTEIQRLRTTMGDAFDTDALTRFGGDVSDPQRLLSGGLPSNVDTDALIRSVFDDEGDADFSLLSGLTNQRDSSAFRNAIEEVKDLGFATGDLSDESRTLRDRLRSVSPKMGDFFKILAALIPVLVAFIAALPAAIAGIAALGAAAVAAAGALGAIGGLGILGIGLEGGQFNMDNISSELENLKRDFIEAFEPVAETFAPVIRNLLDDIGRMFDQIASQGRVLQQLRDEFDAIGDALVATIPGALTAIVQLAEAASPVLQQVMNFFMETDFVAIFADLLEKTVPLLTDMANAFLNMLPVIFQISWGFLVFVSVLATAVSAVFQFLDALGPLAPILGVLGGLFLTLITAISIYSLVAAQAAKITSVFGLTAVKNAVTGLSAYVKALVLGTEATITFATAVGHLTTILGVFVGGALVAGMIAQLSKLQGEISSTKDELGKLAEGSGREFSLSGEGGGVGGSSANPYYQQNNYYVSADDPEDANRTTESLRFGNDSDGAKDNSQFSPQ